MKWLAHGSHITGGDQDVGSIDLETSSSTTDSVQERTFEGVFRSKRRAYVSDSLFEESSLRMREFNY